MDLAALTFEEAFEQLERVVSELQSGDLTLDRAMALFEDGMLLVRRCNDILDGAELRIRQIVPAADGYAIAGLDGAS
jgi:exodeoxyribonuclease VII small subunit